MAWQDVEVTASGYNYGTTVNVRSFPSLPL